MPPYHDRRRWLLAALFLLVAAPLGAFLAWRVPLGHVADEHTHAARADSLLQGEVLAHRANVPMPQQGVDADRALQIVSAWPPPPGGPDSVRDQQWLGPGFEPLGTIASYWPVFYAPAALTLGLAQAAGCLPFDAFRFARLGSLAAFLAIGIAALLVARRGQALLFCTLSMPMTISLAASLNQDGLIIATATLAAALLTIPSATDATRRRRFDLPRLAATALLGSIAMAKPPYLPLAGLLLLPLPAWTAGRMWRQRLALVLLVAIASLGWTWLTVRYVATPVYRPPTEAGPLWPGPRPALFPGSNMATQLRVLLAKPTRFIKLPLHTMRRDLRLVHEFIGVLGWLDVQLPPWLYRLWTWALAAAVAADLVWRRGGAATLHWWEGAWPLACVAACCWGIYLSQYLTWTPIGASLIDGQQGRYFLPLLPAVALAVPSLANRPRLHAVLLGLPAAAALATAAALPRVILRYYAHL